MTPHPVDAHWLDFYALLGVPATADADVIRKRIGKLYTDAAANSDHRDLARRHYFQALLERVLPQCRRVLLDAEWRAKYDRQHILNKSGDPQAQNYVAFITSMRGKGRLTGQEGDEILPERLQEDINLAREVVECAWQGAQLELLPTQSVSNRDASPQDASLQAATQAELAAPAPVAMESMAVASVAAPARRARDAQTHSPAPPAATTSRVVTPVVTPIATPILIAASALAPVKAPEMEASATKAAAPIAAAPIAAAPVQAPIIEEIVQSGETFRAQVITGAEAAAMRRERTASSGRDLVPGAVGNGDRHSQSKARTSRIVVGDIAGDRNGRVLTRTSLNLMVAIVGVLLTITIQHFSGTPAVAGIGRTPIFVAVAPQMESALARAEAAWEQTPDGAGFDLVVQATSSSAGLSRALGAGASLPDVWIPSDTSWVERYNRRAPGLKRQTIGAEGSLAQTPLVLIARAERAGELRRLFPNHQISSWQALRGAVSRGAAGHLGLSGPQKTEVGALARVSMAREWGASRGIAPAQAAKNPEFWRWISEFENNAPSASVRTADMVKDMAQGTTGRFWWVVAYESDALQWMQAGKALEIYYLPRTTLANHPFCALERVGAGNDVAAGRAALEKFLRSPNAQKALLDGGFRPTEINLKTRTERNPFLSAAFRARGARTDGLPLEERANALATEMVAQQWSKRYN